MHIDQSPPKKPRFLVVVILSCVALLVMFVLAYLFVNLDGKHLTLRPQPAHPTSELLPPGGSFPVTPA